ncbi:MAG: hypothetical protein HWN67_04515 [Candidatus Helarchaeota archaeon]|nr:hypothetical protein [Candidatus Helarchaeota archaeon]
MGISYKFTCDGCGYNQVVTGGKDRGLVRIGMTINCNTCKELYDIFLKEENPSIIFSPDWNPPTVYCPKSNDHAVDFWNHPGPCPKCGKTMRKGEGVIEWD